MPAVWIGLPDSLPGFDSRTADVLYEVILEYFENLQIHDSKEIVRDQTKGQKQR
jgi:hypothetical protein